MNVNNRCMNPACGKPEIDYDEMVLGHRKALKKRGISTLKNSVCLCCVCNNLQGADNWETFLKKQGVKDKTMILREAVKKLKESLETISAEQLKPLAEKYIALIKSEPEADSPNASCYTSSKSPSKKKYISKLAKLSEEEINSFIKEATEVKNKEINSPPKEVTKLKKKRGELKHMTFREYKLLT